MAKEYWDSCLFLAYLQNKPEERDMVEVISALLRRAETGDAMIVVSALLLAEIRPLYAYDPNHAAVLWDLFHTNRPYVKLVSLSPRIGELAATIGAEYNAITSPDAVHIATAWSEKVNVMLTLDDSPDKERRRSGQLLYYDEKIGTPPLKIVLPERPHDSQFEFPETNT